MEACLLKLSPQMRSSTAVCFPGYCLTGEKRMGIRQFKMPQSSLPLLRFTPCHAPPPFFNRYSWVSASLWLIFRVLKKQILTIFMRDPYFRDPYSTIFTDTIRNYKIEPNRNTRNKFLAQYVMKSWAEQRINEPESKSLQITPIDTQRSRKIK